MPTDHPYIKFVSGIVSRLYYSLISRGAKPKTISLDDRINKLTSHKEKITITTRRIKNFCNVVKEENPLHKEVEFAQSYGLDNIIAPGTQLAALGEQYIDGLIHEINGIVDKPYILTHFDINFGTHPIYPNTKLLWLFHDFSWNKDGSLNLNIVGGDAKRLRKVEWDKLSKREIKRIGIPIDVRLNPTLYPQEAIQLYAADHKESYTLTKDNVEKFYKSIGEANGEIPWMYPASFITSALIHLSKELKDKPSGMHISTDFVFYQRPKMGELDVELFFRKGEKEQFIKEEKSMYRINAVCSQNHRPILYGKATVLSEKTKSQNINLN